MKLFCGVLKEHLMFQLNFNKHKNGDWFRLVLIAISYAMYEEMGDYRKNIKREKSGK